MRDLTHTKGIFRSLVGSEQILMGEEHFPSVLEGLHLWTTHEIIWLILFDPYCSRDFRVSIH